MEISKKKTNRLPAKRRREKPRVVASLYPIGVIRSSLRTLAKAPKQGSEGGRDAWLEVSPSMAPGLDGLAAGAEIIVLAWLHGACVTPSKFIRAVMSAIH